MHRKCEFFDSEPSQTKLHISCSQHSHTSQYKTKSDGRLSIYFSITNPHTNIATPTHPAMYTQTYSPFPPAKPEPCVISMSSFSTYSNPPTYRTDTDTDTVVDTSTINDPIPPTQPDVRSISTGRRRQTCCKAFTITLIVAATIATIALIGYYGNKYRLKQIADGTGCAYAGYRSTSSWWPSYTGVAGGNTFGGRLGNPLGNPLGNTFGNTFGGW